MRTKKNWYGICEGFHDYYEVKINRDAKSKRLVPDGYRVPTRDEIIEMFEHYITDYSLVNDKAIIKLESGLELVLPAYGYQANVNELKFEDDMPLSIKRELGCYWLLNEDDSIAVNVFVITEHNPRLASTSSKGMMLSVFYIDKNIELK